MDDVVDNHIKPFPLKTGTKYEVFVGWGGRADFAVNDDGTITALNRWGEPLEKGNTPTKK